MTYQSIIRGEVIKDSKHLIRNITQEISAGVGRLHTKYGIATNGKTKIIIIIARVIIYKRQINKQTNKNQPNKDLIEFE